MGISHYLAMTAEEIAAVEVLPEQLAYMACHFSLYGTGLTGVPNALPESALLILNDRIPFYGHDETLIIRQLEQWARELHCSCILLDFQRKDTPLNLGKHLAQALPFPTAVSADHYNGADCPVFLPPVPLDTPLEEYLNPWTGHEIWLEATPETLQITVDPQGCRKTVLTPDTSGSWSFEDTALRCHYRTEVFSDRAVFTLQRTKKDLTHLLEEAASFGVTKAVSLYQQMKKLPV